MTLDDLKCCGNCLFYDFAYYADEERDDPVYKCAYGRQMFSPNRKCEDWKFDS